MLQADARLIIVAGSDTTSATLTFMFYHLAQHPEIVRQLREELDPIVAQAKPVVQDKDLRSAPILNGCINEALRLHPAVPSGLERLTPPEGLQVGDVHIPGNTNFFVPLYVLGRGKHDQSPPSVRSSPN
jgi:tryprostatin B 6-hydroxylase